MLHRHHMFKFQLHWGEVMADSHDLLLIFGFGIVALGIVAIGYFAFLSSQRKQDVQPTPTYVQMPNSLVPFRKE